MFCYGIPLGSDVSKLGLNQVDMWGPWEHRPGVTNCLMSSRVCFTPGADVVAGRKDSSNGHKEDIT